MYKGTNVGGMCMSSMGEDFADQLKAMEKIHGFQYKDEPDFFYELIGVYLEETPSIRTKLQAAIEQKDSEAIYRAAHSLKSSSGNLGAVLLYSLCSELEQISKEGTSEKAVEKFYEFAAEYDRLFLVLDLLRREGESR